MNQSIKYVILGNGIAGLTAAQEIRKRDENSKILIITSEKYLTYYRVKLSHYISKDFNAEDLMIYKEQWYKEKTIDVMLNTNVIGIDTAKNELSLDSGGIIPYEKLLIANGSKPFIPPILGVSKNGVFSLRDIDSLIGIQTHLKNCKKVVVIGGGLLGLEAAWAIKELGKEVSIIEFAPYLLPRQLDESISNLVTDKLRSKGFSIYLNALSKEIIGDNKVEGVILQDGRIIETEAILISAGVKADIDLFKNTDIDVNRGIKVNQYLKTSHKDIYAAGDVVEVNGLSLGLWPIAMEQGKIAGANMTGEKISYEQSEPSTLLSIDDIKVFSTGNVQDFTSTTEHNEKDEIVYKLFIKDDIINGGILYGDTTKMVKLKKAIDNKINIGPMIKEKKSCKEIIEGIK